MTASLDFFSTPFYRAKLDNTNSIPALRSCLLAKETEEFSNANSPQSAHRGLFESRFDLLSWPESPIMELRQKLMNHLAKYLSEINSFDSNAMESLQFKIESWMHISRSGAYFQAHTHPLASVSLIYCVDPGDDDIADNRTAGFVQFFDPRANASMYLDPANRFMHRKYSFNSLRYRLAEDELCIFPSYLQHSVEPYAGNKPRITIAANFSFHLK